MGVIDVGGCDIHYEEWGSGPAVVLTSGGLSPGGAMWTLVPPLARDHRVIVWDRANMGASQVCFDDPSDLDMSAHHLRNLLDRLGVESALLVGTSEGTRVNMRAAVCHPEMVSGMFFWQVSAGAVSGEYLREVNYERYARVAESEGMLAVTRQQFWNERIKFNLTNRSRLLQMDKELFVSRMRSWALHITDDTPIYGHTDDELRQLMQPTWIVAGTDPFHPEANSARVAELMPNARYIPAPYVREDFNPGILEWDDQTLIVERATDNPRGTPATFMRYADLPGIPALIEEFVAAHS